MSLNMVSQEVRQLIYACTRNKLDIVKSLVEDGVDINAKNKNGETALIHASKNGHLEVVKYLVENGADVNTKDDYGETVLSIVSDISCYNIDIVKFLLECGADKSTMKLLPYIKGDLEYFEIFTHHNINKEDGGCYTPLMRAVESGDLDKVKYLVEKGANINHKSSTTGATTPHGGNMPHFGRQFSVLLKSQTALHIAVSCQQVEIIKYLLENGADMYAKDGCNAVPLFRVLIRERSRGYFPNHDASPEDFIKQILPIFLEHGYNIQHSTMLSRIYYRNYNPQIKENTVNILDLASLVNCSDIHKFIVMNSID